MSHVSVLLMVLLIKCPFLNANLDQYNWQCDMFKRYTVDKFLDVEVVRKGVCNTCLEKAKAEAYFKLVLPFKTRPQGLARNPRGLYAPCILD